MCLAPGQSGGDQVGECSGTNCWRSFILKGRAEGGIGNISTIVQAPIQSLKYFCSLSIYSIMEGFYVNVKASNGTVRSDYISLYSR